MKFITASFIALATLSVSQLTLAEESSLMANRQLDFNLQAIKEQHDVQQQTAQKDAAKKSAEDKHC